jgi:hypothetical protein
METPRFNATALVTAASVKACASLSEAPTLQFAYETLDWSRANGLYPPCPYLENSRLNPLTWLAEFTLSPSASLRAVRSRKANGLATLSPKWARAGVGLFSRRAVKLVHIPKTAEKIGKNGKSKMLGLRRIPADTPRINAALLLGHGAGDCLIASPSFPISLLSLCLEGSPETGCDGCQTAEYEI